MTIIKSLGTLLWILAATAQAKTYYVQTKNGMNLRAQPSTDGRVLANLPQGSAVDVLRILHDTQLTLDHMQAPWAEVEALGKKGFAFSGFLLPMPPVELKPSPDPLAAYVEALTAKGMKLNLQTKNQEKLVTLELDSFQQAFQVLRVAYDLGSAFIYPLAGETYLVNARRPPQTLIEEMSFIYDDKKSLKQIHYHVRFTSYSLNVTVDKVEQNLFQWRQLTGQFPK